jgi:hypothetical protein
VGVDAETCAASGMRCDPLGISAAWVRSANINAVSKRRTTRELLAHQ